VADRAHTHACPGKCGAQIARNKLACPADWFRLPGDLRQAVTDNYRRNPDAHFAAVRDAVDWYAANPREVASG
jgi:hypothetical protein